MDNHKNLNKINNQKRLKKDIVFLVVFKIFLICLLVFFIKKVKPLKDESLKNERIMPVFQEK